MSQNLLPKKLRKAVYERVFPDVVLILRLSVGMSTHTGRSRLKPCQHLTQRRKIEYLGLRRKRHRGGRECQRGCTDAVRVRFAGGGLRLLGGGLTGLRAF